MATLRSPRYTFTIPAGIAPGGTYVIELETDPKYADNVPFNTVLLRNFSSQRIEARYGDTLQIMGGSEVMSDTSAYGTRRIIIRNMDTASATSDIVFVMISRDVSAEACIIANTTGESIYSVSGGI